MTVLPSLIQLADCRPFAECGFLQHNHQCLCRLRRTIQQPSPSGLRCPVNGIWENIIISIHLWIIYYIICPNWDIPGTSQKNLVIWGFIQVVPHPSTLRPWSWLEERNGSMPWGCWRRCSWTTWSRTAWLSIVATVRAKASRLSCEITDLGLSENRVPLDPMVYHLFPYQNAILLGYAIFTRIHMVSWLALPEWVGLLIWSQRDRTTCWTCCSHSVVNSQQSFTSPTGSNPQRSTAM